MTEWVRPVFEIRSLVYVFKWAYFVIVIVIWLKVLSVERTLERINHTYIHYLNGRTFKIIRWSSNSSTSFYRTVCTFYLPYHTGYTYVSSHYRTAITGSNTAWKHNVQGFQKRIPTATHRLWILHNVHGRKATRNSTQTKHASQRGHPIRVHNLCRIRILHLTRNVSEEIYL